MALFFCDASADGSYGADIIGNFYGGDPTYSRYMYIKFSYYKSGQSGNTQTIYIQSDAPGDGSGEYDFSAYISGLSAGTRYYWYAVLCYTEQGAYVETSYTDDGTFRTDDYTYTLYATLQYDADGGSPTPSSHTISGLSTSTSGNVSGYVSSTVPTKSGYTFAGWYIGQDGPYQAGDSITVYGYSSGTTYTLVASWAPIGSCRIYTPNGWTFATPYIYTSNGWQQATPYIFANNQWNPTS